MDSFYESDKFQTLISNLITYTEDKNNLRQYVLRVSQYEDLAEKIQAELKKGSRLVHQIQGQNEKILVFETSSPE